MLRLWSTSLCFSRLHVRGVSLIPEHTRFIQRGNLIVLYVACSLCAVKVKVMYPDWSAELHVRRTRSLQNVQGHMVTPERGRGRV